MSGNSAPPYLKGLALALVALLVLTLGTAAYYYSTSAALQAKDQEILRTRIAMLAQNATILNLQLEILSLDQNITGLNRQVVSLLQGRAASNVQIASLTSQVAGLENRSALLGLELSVAENATGHFAVYSYSVNRTVTIPQSSTIQVESQAPGRAGTLVYLSPGGCPSGGSGIGPSTSVFEYSIKLDPGSATVVRSSYEYTNMTAFAFSFQNVGAAPVSCTFSLFYVTA